MQYLDFDTLKDHKILKVKTDNFTYNLLFNQKSVVHTYLPTPALFDYHSKGRYFVLESEARAHNTSVEAARQAEASAPRASVSYHANYYPGYWLITMLGQNPKLGRVRVSHRHYIHVHLFSFVGVHTFSLYHPCLDLFCFLLMCLKNFRKNKKQSSGSSLLSMHA